MSKSIIEIKNLYKIFRLYEKPHYRFLDMIGLLTKSGAYREHTAVNNVSLTIEKGEKVGFIGRNGAGKSTLLKIISGVSPPTAGTVRVNAGLHSLLQIGTGFHPDFTGRENATSYLAQLGISKQEIGIKVNEIISFSELEDYIDQPVKFYSSGMMARLMFSTSTVVSPDLLALDEILGVGDAYFATKSYEKMVELASSENTTVLLVSHDIYSVGRICDRIIWIDGGSIILDDRSAVVIDAYEASVKVQEEARLRSKAVSAPTGSWGSKCVIEILPNKNGGPILNDFRLFNIALIDGDLVVDIGSEGFLEQEAIEKMLDTGLQLLSKASAVSKDILVVNLSDNMIERLASGRVEVCISYGLSSDAEIVLRLWVENSCIAQSELTLTGEEQNGQTQAKSPNFGGIKTATNSFDLNFAKIWTGNAAAGSGVVKFKNFDVLSANGQSHRLFSGNDDLFLTCDYEVMLQSENKFPVQILVAFRGKGQQDLMRVISDEPIELEQRGLLKLEIKRNWHLVSGDYRIIVAVVKPGYYAQQGKKFFSINDDVYLLDTRAIDLCINDHIPELDSGCVLTSMSVVNNEKTLEQLAEVKNFSSLNQ